VPLVYGPLPRNGSTSYIIISVTCPKEGADVAVEEDHRGGTVSQESDVTDTALGGNGTALHR
jgi:hypothetical protein